MSAITRLFGVRCPMRDGVGLSCDIWLPNAEGRHPLVLIRTPYLKSAPPAPNAPVEYFKLARFFVEKGYAVAVQDVRGRGDSEGEYGYYFQEAHDGYDTIEWMAAQPWSTGRVGTMGFSYAGAAQWFAASQAPPHLVCMATAASPGDFLNELPYVGGAFLLNRLSWTNIVAGKIYQNNVRDDEWAGILKHRPLLTADERLGRKMPLYRLWLDHPTLDGYWQRLRLTDRDYRNIDVPVLHITGWFDSNQPGALYHWQGMAEHSSMAHEQYLIVGPWDHAQTSLGGALQMGELEFTDDSLVDLWQLHLEFFDRFLKQTASRFNCPRVKLYVTGSNTWETFDRYPIAGATTTRLYLSCVARANSLWGDGRLIVAPADNEPPDEYEYDPQDPVPLDPFTPGAMYGVDRRALERRDDVLVYTGQRLSARRKVIGRVQVELYAASDVPDTDFTASVLDVYPDGRAVVLGARVTGIIRARYRHSLEKAQPLTPGQIEQYHIDLGHIAHTFEPGHHIRLEISSSAAPLYNPNQNTGNPVATDIEWRVAHQTIYHDSEHPSALILPIVA